MFDPENAIAEWRRQMTAEGVGDADRLDELESHLRDEIAGNMRLGLDPARAFAISVERMGEASRLEAEFKVARDFEDSRRLRRFHVLAGVFAAVYSVTAAAYFLSSDKFDVRNRLLGLAAVAFGVGIVCGWRRICAHLPVVPAKRARVAIGLTIAILGNSAVAVFFNLGLPRLQFSEGGLVVAVLWTVTLLSISGSIWHGLDEAARLRASDAARISS